MTLVKNTYTSRDNFLIDRVTSVPKNTSPYYSNPFKIVDKPNIKNHILSKNYWGNEVAVYAMSMKLKLNIIVITNNSQPNNILGIPFIYTNNNNWDKYLFLYWKNNHFELISFNNTRTIINKRTIFERNSEIYPPLYIIFLIFTRYITYIDSEKRLFSVLPEFMTSFNNAFTQIVELNKRDPYNKDSIEFFTNLLHYSPNVSIKGGAPNTYNPYQNYKRYPNYNPYQNYNPYPNYKPYQNYNPYPNYKPYSIYNQKINPYLVQNMIKNENDLDPSQLAYFIKVDLELYPGTSITPNQMKNLKCRNKWNAIRKSYANFIGRPYVISPIYPKQTIKNKNGNNQNKTIKKRVK